MTNSISAAYIEAQAAEIERLTAALEFNGRKTQAGCESTWKVLDSYWKRRAEKAEDALETEIKISNERGNRIEFDLIPSLADAETALETARTDALREAAVICEKNRKALDSGYDTPFQYHKALQHLGCVREEILSLIKKGGDA